MTDQTVYIPAGLLATNGQATVSAHSVVTGLGGNIKGGDIYGPCCRLNVFAANGAFTDGQAERSYQSVTQQDIDGAVSSLKASLLQSTQAAFQAQVKADETLITPVPCTPTITADKKPGEEATQATVTLEENCTGEAYNTAAMQALLKHAADEEATKQLGTGYSLMGEIQTSITQSSQKQDSLALQVKATGVYGYQFTSEQQQRIKTLVAGKTKAQASAILTAFPGIQAVSISIKNHGTTLPADSHHIQVTFLMTGWNE